MVFPAKGLNMYYISQRHLFAVGIGSKSVAETADKKISRLKPPVWDLETRNYNDCRFLVEMWSTDWEKAKLAKDDRGYMLF